MLESPRSLPPYLCRRRLLPCHAELRNFSFHRGDRCPAPPDQYWG
jgi:hypothetical protein